MPLLPLIFWQGRDNATELVLLHESPPVVYDPSSITRFVVGLDDDDVVVDSALWPAAFAWPVDVVYRGESVPGIRLNLGLADVAPRTYGDCRLIVYSDEWAGGMVWSEAFMVKVR